MIAAAVIALAFVAYATRLSGNDSTNPPPAGQARPAAAAQPPGGAFTARTLDGTSIDVPGSRPSVLFFYSVACGACGPGVQSLAEAQAAVGAGANFVAVNVDTADTDADINGFLSENHAQKLALIRDADARLLQAYQVNQLSTAVILDPSGKVAVRTFSEGVSRPAGRRSQAHRWVRG